MTTEFDIEQWLPMMPNEGPPFPRIFGINWPWYSEEQEPTPPPNGGDEILLHYCPYCEKSFATAQDLADHVKVEHPDQPPMEVIHIEWG